MIHTLERRILVALFVIGLVWTVTKHERSWQSGWIERGVQSAEPFSAAR